MGRPKKSDSRATRELLLRAAEQQFGANGYSRTRLQDIAEAAGIRRPSLLYHFGSKEQLYREVVLHVSSALRAEVGAALGRPAASGSRLAAVADVLWAFARERSAGVTMFVRELLDPPPSGRENMLELAALIDSLEQAVRADAGDRLPADAPVRAALLHIVTSQALRIAAGDLGDVLWGPDLDPRVFLRELFPHR